MYHKLSYAITIALLFLMGCSSSQSISQAPSFCEQQIQALSQITQSIGVTHGEAIQDEPLFRFDRYSHALAQEVDSPEKHTALLAYMGKLALEGLSNEFYLLPQKQQQAWLLQTKTSSPEVFISECLGQKINQEQANYPASLSRLKQFDYPSSYSTPARALGLYPLSALVFNAATRNEYEKFIDEWQQTSSVNPLLYQPSSNPTELLTEFSVNPLGIPEIPQAQAYLDAFAPEWLIEQDPNFPESNQLQQVVWNSESNSVDTQTENQLYSFISYGYEQQQSILQLNYLIWFKQRPAEGLIDSVAGKHDALLVRYHLNAQLELIAIDSIHLCGCWYRLFTPIEAMEKTVNQIIEKGLYQQPVLFQQLPLSQKLRIHVSANHHQIIDIQAANSPLPKTVKHAGYYQQKQWQQLYRLASPQGFKAAFDRDGYVANSKRPEQYWFWPMGIPKTGQLRRTGLHAIDFVGERYFDQVNILSEQGIPLQLK